MRSLKLKPTSLTAFSMATALAFPLLLNAGDRLLLKNQPPVLTEKHLIENAVQISLSPRGMKFFETGIIDLLESQGVSLEQAHHDGFNWTASQSYKFDDLSIPQEQRELFKMVSQLMTKWLVGFSFNEFRPSIQVGDFEYMAYFNRFALVPNELLLRKLGKTDGAVLSIEVEIQKMQAHTDSLNIKDLNNQFLGEVGAQDINVRIGSDKTPLKLKLPFYVRMNERKELEFQVLDFESNIEAVEIDIAKPAQILVPTVALEINGHRYQMNKKQLEQEVSDRLPVILQKAKSFLDEFATKQLPAFLNQKAKEMLAGGLEETNRMDPVGATKNPCLPQPVEYLWGLKVTGINMNNGLNLNLGAFVEDPLAPKTPLLTSLNAREMGNLDEVAKENYDIALSIDRGFINRMLQLSFNRHVFDNMPIDKKNPNGPKMDLTMMPELDYTPPPVNAPIVPHITYLKMKTMARVHPGFLSGIQKFALKEPFEIRLDVIVKMMKNQYGEIRLYYHDVDPNSVSIDSKYIRLAAGTVRKKAIEALQEVAKNWRETGAQVSDDPLPIPSEIGGIRLEPQTIRFSKSGHLNLYMNYATGATPIKPKKPIVQCISAGVSK